MNETCAPFELLIPKLKKQDLLGENGFSELSFELFLVVVLHLKEHLKITHFQSRNIQEIKLMMGANC